METQTTPRANGARLRSVPQPSPAPERSAAHVKLDVFLGRWRGEGHLGEGAPLAANARAVTYNSIDPMPGGFFVVNRGTMRFADQILDSTAIYSYDEGTRRYRMYLFDNAGFARLYEGIVEDNRWSFRGEHERATITFSANGDAMTTFWEVTSDGRTWKPLCHLEANREQPAADTDLGKLSALVGTWKAHGRTIERAGHPAVEFVGTDTYEWLPGGFFLNHRTDGYLGNKKIDALEIIGPYDPERGCYRMRSFDQAGDVIDWEARAGKDGVWIFTGPTMRAMLTLDVDGKRGTAFWEALEDGQWVPFMDLTLSR
jgi:hypothetical protein